MAPAPRGSLLLRHPEIRHSGVGSDHVRGAPNPTPLTHLRDGFRAPRRMAPHVAPPPRRRPRCAAARSRALSATATPWPCLPERGSWRVIVRQGRVAEAADTSFGACGLAPAPPSGNSPLRRGIGPRAWRPTHSHRRSRLRVPRRMSIRSGRRPLRHGVRAPRGGAATTSAIRHRQPRHRPSVGMISPFPHSRIHEDCPT